MPRPAEDELIARYLAPLAGPGGLGLRDDAALATPRPGHDLVVTKDMLVADVHFFADDPPDAIARKALRVNLSDWRCRATGPRPGSPPSSTASARTRASSRAPCSAATRWPCRDR